MNGKCLFRFVSRKTFFLDSNKNRIFARTVKTASSPNPLTIEAEEIKIPVPWGHIAGKWWGPKTKRPVLMLHGWQDNCGTFNTLVPLLNPKIGYLGIDFPGHGRSSHFPLGTYSLHLYENELTIRRIAKYFNWELVSLISHSMGSAASFMYTGLYPDSVDILVGLDALKPYSVSTPELMTQLPRSIDNYLKAEMQIISGSEPPSYSYEEMARLLHEGTGKSIDEDKCFHIINRNSEKSKMHPDKYYFSRDSRLRSAIVPPIETDMSIAFAKRIKCPMLTIRAANGMPFDESAKFLELIDVLKENNKRFKYVEVPGLHHVHLNQPETVAPLINEYLNKYCQHLMN